MLKHAEARDTPPDVKLSIVAALQRLGPHRLDASGDKKNAVRELLGGLTGDDASSARELMCIFVRAPEADGGEAAGTGRRRRRRARGGAEQEAAVGAGAGCRAVASSAARDAAELLEFLVAHAYYREEDAGVSRKAAKRREEESGGREERGERAPEASRKKPLAEPVDGLREACAVRASALLAANVGGAKRGRRGGEAAAEPKEKAGEGGRQADPPAGLAGGGGGAVPRAGSAGNGAALVDDMPEECEGPRLARSALDAAPREAKAAKARKEDSGDAWRWPSRRCSARSPCCR